MNCCKAIWTGPYIVKLSKFLGVPDGNLDQLSPFLLLPTAGCLWLMRKNAASYANQVRLEPEDWILDPADVCGELSGIGRQSVIRNLRHEAKLL
ncbi:hypothetical protein ASE37_21720 [Rhizobium sp. Root268]|nr:hypothetical protein ASC86_23150 [Rhizobium sp. Root1212]KRD35141.1 hypothetical protein ASE37_21720 [Rhizobium sp. Root268]